MQNSFGKTLKVLRQERNLSQAELGVMLSVANNTISSWERDNSEPCIDQIVRLAQIFAVTTDYLLGLEI